MDRKACDNGCGRLAAEEAACCCVECGESGGRRHGHKCQALNEKKADDEARGYRAARSVHLRWKPKGEEDITAFYNEVRVETSTHGSYFMVCGFPGGYFGIQEMLDGSHRVLFSVWDASSQLYQGRDDPRLIAKEDRVEILSQAPDVLVQRFGGEGTGAQCLDDATGWQVGDLIACLVECRRSPSGRTCYAGHVRNKANASWKHLATYRVACGKPFKGFNSFVEDFRRDYDSTMRLRLGHYGPAWFRTASGDWVPASEFTFSASSATWERPDNIDSREGDRPGIRTLATGGDKLAGALKLKSTVPLLPGLDGPPCAAPRTDFPADGLQVKRARCEGPQEPARPLCGGSMGDAGGGPAAVFAL